MVINIYSIFEEQKKQNTHVLSDYIFATTTSKVVVIINFGKYCLWKKENNCFVCIQCYAHTPNKTVKLIAS